MTIQMWGVGRRFLKINNTVENQIINFVVKDKIQVLK